MPVEVRERAFDPYTELQHYERTVLRALGKFGATVSFVGTMRDFNDDETVQSMTLEHYPGMTEKQLDVLAAEAKSRWPVLDALVVHRVGVITPAESIVLVAVWAAHRAAAFEACRYLIEALKARAPFWKKESTVRGGVRWVERNTPCE